SWSGNGCGRLPSTTRGRLSIRLATAKVGPVVHEGTPDDGPPSLAAAHGRLHCVFRDSTGTIQHLSYDKTSWTSPSPVPGRKWAHSPALALLKDRLCLF
ncbi:hypothetical protein AB0G02_41190, partial [Actinosynnema sp. NPDC023658]|uniref:hypothetical protein n=1 Tax=Actinosynnema sp. NPDC023658 TaxID=3155465 RepID=UPI0033D10FDA